MREGEAEEHTHDNNTQHTHTHTHTPTHTQTHTHTQAHTTTTLIYLNLSKPTSNPPSVVVSVVCCVERVVVPAPSPPNHVFFGLLSPVRTIVSERFTPLSRPYSQTDVETVGRRNPLVWNHVCLSSVSY